MNNRAIITNPDNSLSVLIPAPEMFDPMSRTRQALRARGIDFNSDIEAFNWVVQKDIPSGSNFRIVDISELPADRLLRNAWIDNGVQVSYDMPKANNLKRDEFRQIRAPLLAALDVEYMRADEASDANKKREIGLKKQALRDVTNFPDFTDINLLKAYMPDILKPSS